MSGQVKTGGNESKNNMMSRRTTLTLAAAVATFGAAMGMRAPAAWAQGKMEGDSDERRNYDRDRDVERNRDRDYDRDGERRGEGRGDG
jgi:Ni/Co efflux regulator RcnB